MPRGLTSRRFTRA